VETEAATRYPESQSGLPSWPMPPLRLPLQFHGARRRQEDLALESNFSAGKEHSEYIINALIQL
jgi:hypothetical protein